MKNHIPTSQIEIYIPKALPSRFPIPLFLSLVCLFSSLLADHRVQSQTQQGTVRDSRGYGSETEKPIKALIVDGQNNHDWETTTDSLRATLEAAGLFSIEVSTAPRSSQLRTIRPPKDDAMKSLYSDFDQLRKSAFQKSREKLDRAWKNWNPNFADHHVVVLNYNGRDWNPETKSRLVEYVKNGGGLVLVHAANNAFRNWKEFNEIIGMGWRPAPSGKAIKIDGKTGHPYWDKSAGNSGHGSKHPFQITVRKPDHPIMRGLPKKWMHGSDELYHDMRGPAANLTILSSAYSDANQRGTGKHEPITWEVKYGKGRVIVTTMGHFWAGQDNFDSLHCAGFQTIFARSCEYAATENVQQKPPADFPNETDVSIRIPSTPTPQPSGSQSSAENKKKANPYCMLTPGEELTTFQIAPGYDIELIASEPQVQEPVLTVWDGNGVMYVSEMRSYMQNVAGEGTKEAKNSRIKRLEDTNGDGAYDRVTIFADNLNLPRAILPLDDRIAVRETDSMDIFSLRDTDGDGVADERTLLYERGSYGRGAVGVSVEHQDSGLIWNIDNHIYITYNIERYRFTDGTWRAEKQRSHWTQWGLTHNDTGDLFWSSNSAPVAAPYLHPKYWDTVNRLAGKGIHGTPVDMGPPYSPEFLQVQSLCLLNDRGGAAPEVRGFTSVCGQSDFRGNKLQLADNGRYFIVDPTIHVLRRSNITTKEGLDYLEKTEPGQDEFLRSSDINCRFVNTATGPDGSLYLTDMYRGIIQDAAWLSSGPRKNIVAAGLDKNIQHGRIWRIRSAGVTPGRMPRMLDESTVELLHHLEHPNGWRRDTAQKLIILREDRETVAPLLEGMVRFSQNALTRLHALWTLEGIGVLEPSFVAEPLRDRDPRVRRAAIQICERWLDSRSVISLIGKLAEDNDPSVARQVILSLGLVREEENISAAEEHIQRAARRHSKDNGVILAATISLWGKKHLPWIEEIEKNQHPDAVLWKPRLANWSRGISFPKGMDDTHRRLVRDGEVHYFKSCVACHGANGEGMEVPGTELRMAPSLVESPRVAGDPEKLASIMLKGLMGPLDGKNYQAGFMAPAAALGITRDDHIAQVLSYIRYAWGRQAPPVTKEQVESAKKRWAARKTPWTQAELEEE